MTRTIYRERIVPYGDQRLKRNIYHDSESWRYPHRPRRTAELKSVEHKRNIPYLNQGGLGSCTGNAAIAALARGKLYEALLAYVDLTPWPTKWYTLNENGAVNLYSWATQHDPFGGEWPPDDTGSDGLTVAKGLKASGQIEGYTHGFDLETCLAGLQELPYITGTYWKSDMYNRSSEGLVQPTGRNVGGHEYVAEAYDAVRGWVGFGQSWYGWDRFWIEAEKYGNLLAEDGDATFFTPLDQPAPTPDPTIDDLVDQVYAITLRPWLKGWHPTSKKVRRAGRTWLDAKGLS